MANEAQIEFTFVSECGIPADVNDLLISGEQAIAAYQTIRDSAIFTDRRLIIRDAQGITGKKVEIYSIPWDAVNMWSSENGGTLDLTAEIELWTRAGHMKLNLKKGIDIRKLDSIIASRVLA